MRDTNKNIYGLFDDIDVSESELLLYERILNYEKKESKVDSNKK